MIVEKLLAPIRRRLRRMIMRAIVNLTDDSGGLQLIQISVSQAETRDQVERLQNYGFTSRPFAGSEALILCVGGVADHGLLIAVDDRRYRLKNLAEGEVALYTDEGDKIHFKRGRIIEVIAGTKLSVTAPEIDLIANTKVKMQTPAAESTGNVADVTGTMQQMRNIYNTHTHTDPQGGVTGVPNQAM